MVLLVLLLTAHAYYRIESLYCLTKNGDKIYSDEASVVFPKKSNNQNSDEQRNLSRVEGVLSVSPTIQKPLPPDELTERQCSFLNPSGGSVSGSR